MDKKVELESYINEQELPIDYLILKLKVLFNNELLEKKIISLDIYKRMQEILFKRINKIFLGNRS